MATYNFIPYDFVKSRGAQLNDIRTFHEFIEFPAEIRHEIWRFASLEPRVVAIREWPQGKVWKREMIGRYKSTAARGGGCPGFVAERDLQPIGRSSTGEILYCEDCRQHRRGQPAHCIHSPINSIEFNNANDKYEIYSSSQAPAVLFVCKESYEIASEFYELTFSSKHGTANTFFNFQNDTLYVHSGTINWNKPKHYPTLESIENISQSQLEKVENLAIWIKPHGLWAQQPMFNFIKAFKGLKNLSMVSHHIQTPYASSFFDRSPLLLIDQQDVCELIPRDHTWCNEDMSEYFHDPRIMFESMNWTRTPTIALQSWNAEQRASKLIIQEKVAISRNIFNMWLWLCRERQFLSEDYEFFDTFSEVYFRTEDQTGVDFWYEFFNPEENDPDNPPIPDIDEKIMDPCLPDDQAILSPVVIHEEDFEEDEQIAAQITWLDDGASCDIWGLVSNRAAGLWPNATYW